MEHELKDRRGHTIKAGTPLAFLSRGKMADGVVTAVYMSYGALRVDVKDATGKNHPLRAFNNVLVLPRTNHEASHG